VANSSSSTIKEFTNNNGTLSHTGTIFASTNLNTPYGLAFDASNNLYVANIFGNTILKYTYSGGVLNPTGTNIVTVGLNNPAGLAFDGSGHLYVVNNLNATIAKYTSTGGNLGQFASLGTMPTFLAFQPPLPEPLKFQVANANVILTWKSPLFTLQAGPTLTNFTDIPDATSPYTNSLTGPPQFFRLQSNQQ
jgi:hypothetical protein